MHHSCTQTGTHEHMTLLELACRQQASNSPSGLARQRTMQTKVTMLSPVILEPMMQLLQNSVVYDILHPAYNQRLRAPKEWDTLADDERDHLLQCNVKYQPHQTIRAYLCSGHGVQHVYSALLGVH